MPGAYEDLGLLLPALQQAVACAEANALVLKALSVFRVSDTDDCEDEWQQMERILRGIPSFARGKSPGHVDSHHVVEARSTPAQNEDTGYSTLGSRDGPSLPTKGHSPSICRWLCLQINDHLYTGTKGPSLAQTHSDVGTPPQRHPDRGTPPPPTARGLCACINWL